MIIPFCLWSISKSQDSANFFFARDHNILDPIIPRITTKQRHTEAKVEKTTYLHFCNCRAWIFSWKLLNISKIVCRILKNFLYIPHFLLICENIVFFLGQGQMMIFVKYFTPAYLPESRNLPNKYRRKLQRLKSHNMAI